VLLGGETKKKDKRGRTKEEGQKKSGKYVDE
jgi:hypothetical protein